MKLRVGVDCAPVFRCDSGHADAIAAAIVFLVPNVPATSRNALAVDGGVVQALG